ncbi:MAG: tRNA (adenosine(37)-N6)-threonylcarbamoyltransferase complex ATPase subunit type 1 TsaE [Pseudomonadota bacterium]
MKLDLPDASATEALGAAIAHALKSAGSGLVIFLFGDLGAGKTTLARQLLRELGVTGTIRSPTYTLMELYSVQGRDFLHMDLYRLNDPAELHNLGLTDYPPAQTLWLVEWPEKGGDLLPSADISITLSVAELARKADVLGLSEAGRQLVSKLS